MKTIMVFSFLLLSNLVFSQDLTIDCKVTDMEGNPLESVSIVTNLLGVGTTSQKDGSFSLAYNENITRITFSAVGFYPRSYKINELPEVVKLETMLVRGKDLIISASRAESGINPIAFDNFSSDDISRDYTIGEFPLLLETTPNLYSYSDGGGSLGYSYIKIRGFDDKRVSTYINGVPLNDPEDHATYFVDLPDFAANVTDVQVQRGVGNSLYGDGSFGGSINIETSVFHRKRNLTLLSGYGEYTYNNKSFSDMYKQSLSYSSGLIDGVWSFEGRFSKQKSGGFRNNSWYEGWAYYLAAGRVDPNMTTELYFYGGPMRMHLAYYGASRDDIKANRLTNSNLSYDNETDNFNQPHFHLHNKIRLNDKATLSNTLYYIKGKGYYEQFKYDKSYFDHNLTQFSDSTSGNLVRQRWVNKRQFGWNPRLTVDHSKGSHAVGGSFYYFKSEHWGQVIQAEYLNQLPNQQIRYYEYFGKKTAASLFVEENYIFNSRLSTQITVQLRYQSYDFTQSKIGAFLGHEYNLDYLFFSPRIGFNLKINENLNSFVSFALASRAPSDNAIYDASDPTRMPSLQIESIATTTTDTVYNFGDPTFKSESVFDLELGLNYSEKKFAGSLNLFWINFKNEIVSYAFLDNLPSSFNIDKSVHAGVELTGNFKATSNLSLSGNYSYNYNRIKNYIADVDGYAIDYKNKKIPGFPDYLANIIADYNLDNWRITFRNRFSGRQYMELFNDEATSIEPYSVSSVSIQYKIPNFANMGALSFSLSINNIFNEKYESSGYGGNFAYPDPVPNGNVNDVNTGQRLTVGSWAEYFVAAERNFFGLLKLEMF